MRKPETNQQNKQVEQIKNSEKGRKKISTGLIVGFIAIMINIITVTVYVYQTNIMQSQQHASVWPYLEWRILYNQNDGFKLRIKNNGIGPALIKQSSMRLEGDEITDLDTLFSRLLGTSRFPHLTSEIENRVLPSGESINMIASNDPKWSELLFINLRQYNFELEICYESIYKDQWTCKGMEVVDSKCKVDISK